MGGLRSGMFRKHKPQRAGRPAWKCAEEFKRHLRHLECARCGKKPGDSYNPVCAAHVDLAGQGTRDAKGVSSKVSDRFCIPLCNSCHWEQTDVVGWPEFQKLLPLGDAEKLAREYWAHWPGRFAWEADLRAQGIEP